MTRKLDKAIGGQSDAITQAEDADDVAIYNKRKAEFEAGERLVMTAEASAAMLAGEPLESVLLRLGAKAIRKP
jgi:hypothetical protein